MKCLIVSGSLRHGKEGEEARPYEVGDEVDLTRKEYLNLAYMLKPAAAVIAEEKAKEIIEKGSKI